MKGNENPINIHSVFIYPSKHIKYFVANEIEILTTPRKYLEMQKHVRSGFTVDWARQVLVKVCKSTTLLCTIPKLLLQPDLDIYS